MTRTMLFLSWKVTWVPEPLCAQPSGYFINQPAAAERKTRKTWLSGMSPVAAELASAWRAPAPVAGAVVVAAGCDVAARVEDPTEGVPAELRAPPHAVRVAALATARTAPNACRIGTTRCCPHKPEGSLNVLGVRRSEAAVGSSSHPPLIADRP